MKIWENDSAHDIRFKKIKNYFDDLHLQIIESISPKASVENSSAHWAIFYYLLPLIMIWKLHRKYSIIQSKKIDCN